MIPVLCLGQNVSYQREFETPDKLFVSVKNQNGRVTIVASAELLNKARLEASSSGIAVAESDIATKAAGGKLEIDVRQRREQDRIDLVVRVPVRSKVEVESGAGAVSVVGNVESAVVKTDTGTIHADVPLDALKYDFVWEASRPRYMSDVELKEVKRKLAVGFDSPGNSAIKKHQKRTA
jgi:DUF4097 and DUF4098 domain-containing protein YvlB